MTLSIEENFMDQLHNSSLFQISRLVHPITLISAFKGYPLFLENKTDLVGLLNFILNEEIPAHLFTEKLVLAKCKAATLYLRTTFSDIQDFANKITLEEIKELDKPVNNAYKLKWIEYVESHFGKSLSVIKPKNSRQTANIQEEKDLINDPILQVIGAYGRTHLVSAPNFSSLFRIHKQITDNEPKEKENYSSKAKL